MTSRAGGNPALCLSYCNKIRFYSNFEDQKTQIGYFGINSEDPDEISNKANSTNLYPPMKGYLRETYKSQNINPIYLTLSSPTVSFRS